MNRKIGILLLGSTGTGKSSIVRLLTGDNSIEVSDKSESCTKQTDFYVFENYVFIDTRGFQDCRYSDEKIIYEIIKECNDKGIEYFKLIFCFTGQERANSQITREMEFISNLDVNIWNSTLFVEKTPQISKMCKHVVAAMRKFNKIIEKNGCEVIDNNHPNYIGAIVLDFIDENERDEYSERKNVFTAENYKKILHTKLDKLNECKITFYNAECAKCHQKFHRKFPTPKCHDDYYKFHDEGEYEHERELYHPNEAEAQDILNRMKNGLYDARTGLVATGTTSGISAILGSTVLGEIIIAPVLITSAVGAAKGIYDNKKVHKCCNKYEGEIPGCKQRYKCCLTMCNGKVVVTDKCWVCKKCNKLMCNSLPCLENGTHIIK